MNKELANDASFKLLVVEDDQGLRTQLRWALSDFDVSLAENRSAALALFQKKKPSVVLLDLGLPPNRNDPTEGLAFLKEALELAPLTKIIVASGNAERGIALEAIDQGAYDFYSKPVDLQVLKMIIRRAWNSYQLEAELHQIKEREQNTPLAGLVAGCPEMLRICRMIERVATSDVAVMITGESGTGKDLVAQAIHRLSPRQNQPFVAINCAAIPEALLESELFGHERGAFTGAVKQVIGKIEAAHRGTLFLDEIGDMPASLQAKLLRFLQDKILVRVGSHKSIDVDVRVIAATNKDIPAMMADGRFREDLFYRLNEIGIHVPPLRERPGDAVLVALYLLRKLSVAMNRNVKGFTREALTLIDHYAWPGNVREIENKIKRAIVMSDGKHITAEDLDLSGKSINDDGGAIPLRRIREDSERRAVVKALAIADNNMSEAAKILSVSRPTLYSLIKTLNVVRGAS